MKKQNFTLKGLILILTLLTCSLHSYSQNIHGQDQVGTPPYALGWGPVRHFEVAQFGVGGGQKVFIGGRESVGNITWNAYPGDNSNWGSRFLLSGVHTAQMRYESWSQNFIIRFSDPTQIPVAGQQVNWINALRFDGTGQSFFCASLNAPRVVVAIPSWCDYVFEKDYKLMPIYALEKFINTYKHLPEIPSEKELVSNNLDLGEMQRLQIKKIEELTLYTIQQQKEIDSLKIQISKIYELVNNLKK